MSYEITASGIETHHLRAQLHEQLATKFGVELLLTSKPQKRSGAGNMGCPSPRMIPILERDELDEREPRYLCHIGLVRNGYLKEAKQVDCHQSCICDGFSWVI